MSSAPRPRAREYSPAVLPEFSSSVPPVAPGVKPPMPGALTKPAPVWLQPLGLLAQLGPGHVHRSGVGRDRGAQPGEREGVVPGVRVLAGVRDVDLRAIR